MCFPYPSKYLTGQRTSPDANPNPVRPHRVLCSVEVIRWTGFVRLLKARADIPPSERVRVSSVWVSLGMTLASLANLSPMHFVSKKFAARFARGSSHRSQSTSSTFAFNSVPYIRGGTKGGLKNRLGGWWVRCR
jgi:hypothetical protein